MCTTSHKHSPKTSASLGHEGTRKPANKARSILHKNKKKQLADERPFAEEKAVCIIIKKKALRNCDGLKTMGDLHSFPVGLWVCQLDVHVWSSVTCWCICPVCVLSFCILNNREYQDSFFINDQASCSESKGIHPAALAAVNCISPEYHLQILVHAVNLLLQWKTEKTG